MSVIDRAVDCNVETEFGCKKLQIVRKIRFSSVE